MKSEMWISVLVALIIAGFIAEKQASEGFTHPAPVVQTVVGGP